MFYERGAPSNCSVTMTPSSEESNPQDLQHSGLWLRFWAAYALTGNRTVERSYRKVKVIAAKNPCSSAVAVHLYNVTPVKWRRRPRLLRNICVWPNQEDQVDVTLTSNNKEAEYTLGKAVLVRKGDERYTSASHRRHQGELAVGVGSRRCSATCARFEAPQLDQNNDDPLLRRSTRTWNPDPTRRRESKIIHEWKRLSFNWVAFK